MKSKVEQVLTALNSRLGYADPRTCKYMFIGIEEGGGPYDLDDFAQTSPPLDLWVGTVSKNRKSWSPVYTIMSKIVAALEGITDLESYQTTQMCHRGDVTGLINLFPLPKKEVNTWPYTTLTREQYQEWLFYHIHERYTAIRKECQKMPNLKATICFGSDNRQDFINCLQLSWERFEEKDSIRIYPERKVLLKPFFQYRYGTVDDERIIPMFVDAIKNKDKH